MNTLQQQLAACIAGTPAPEGYTYRVLPVQGTRASWTRHVLTQDMPEDADPETFSPESISWDSNEPTLREQFDDRVRSEAKRRQAKIGTYVERMWAPLCAEWNLLNFESNAMKCDKRMHWLERQATQRQLSEDEQSLLDTLHAAEEASDIIRQHSYAIRGDETFSTTWDDLPDTVDAWKSDTSAAGVVTSDYKLLDQLVAVATS